MTSPATTNRRVTTDFEYESECLAALIAVMRETNYTIRAADFNRWRATIRTSGHITGLDDLGELTILATNGLLGLFCRHATDTFATHHTQHFTGAIEPLVRKPKPPHHADGNPSARPVRKRTVSKRDRITADLLGVTVEYLHTLK